MKTTNLKIAIQSNGRLNKPSLEFLRWIGLSILNHNSRSLITTCSNAPLEILFVRHNDIPQFVQAGIADYGIAGENILNESNCTAIPIKKLGFGKCSLVIAKPKFSSIKNISDLADTRIATTYPNSLKQFLKSKNVQAQVVAIAGSVEISPKLGLADAICDLTQTGTTLKENDLVILEKIFESEATLIKSPTLTNMKQQQLQNILEDSYEKVLCKTVIGQ